MSEPIVLDLPFSGRWLVRNSPASRVPSHGTHTFGVTFAIDFIAVDDDGRSASRSWQSLLWVEPPEKFRGFGAPILAPAEGTVVVAHDGEPDHVARRSQFGRASYALGQPKRVRDGIAAIAGNHVVISLGSKGPFVTLAHLRQGSIGVSNGDAIVSGKQVGECGNSGNSTEPHVHVQVTDSTNWPTARGLPMAFRNPSDAKTSGVPGESDVVTGQPRQSYTHRRRRDG